MRMTHEQRIRLFFVTFRLNLTCSRPGRVASTPFQTVCRGLLFHGLDRISCCCGDEVLSLSAREMF
jgi:hypothetical protein